MGIVDRLCNRFEPYAAPVLGSRQCTARRPPLPYTKHVLIWPQLIQFSTKTRRPPPLFISLYVIYIHMLYVNSRYIFCIMSGKRKKTGGKEKKESLYIYDLRSGLDSLVVMTDNWLIGWRGEGGHHQIPSEISWPVIGQEIILPLSLLCVGAGHLLERERAGNPCHMRDAWSGHSSPPDENHFEIF